MGGDAHMPSGIPSSEVSAVVMAAFERAPGPLTLAGLEKALTKPFQAQDTLREAVSGLMAEGRIHRWPGRAKSEKYWVRRARRIHAREDHRGPASRAAVSVAEGLGAVRRPGEALRIGRRRTGV